LYEEITPYELTPDFLAKNLNSMSITIQETCKRFEDYGFEFKWTPTIWLNMIATIIDTHPDAEELVHNSLFIHRLYDTMSSITWAMVSVYSAGYESALRDLRFWSEDITQVYYLDQELTDATKSEKISHIAKLEKSKPRLSGTTLMKKCVMDERLKHEFIEIFRSLSKYVHPTEKMERNPQNASEYDWGISEKRFRLCIDFHRKVYDCITALILSTYSIAFMNHEDGLMPLILQLINQAEFPVSKSLLGLD